MMAAEGGHVETVVTLIKHGASVDLKDRVSFWSQQLKCYHNIIVIHVARNFCLDKFFA